MQQDTNGFSKDHRDPSEEEMNEGYAPINSPDQVQNREIEADRSSVNESTGGAQQHYEEGSDPSVDSSLEPGNEVAPEETVQGYWSFPSALSDLISSHCLPSEIPAAFALSPDFIIASVENELYSRVRGLLAMDGHFGVRPEMKKYAGKKMDQPFGKEENRMVRFSGQGNIYFAAQGRHFTPFFLKSEEVYLCEDSLFAFQEAVSYENGRVPSKSFPDLKLVRLEGNGAVLIESKGPVVSIMLSADRPVKIPFDQLTGWTGEITPRIIGWSNKDQGIGRFLSGVELVGEGAALISLPPHSQSNR